MVFAYWVSHRDDLIGAFENHILSLTNLPDRQVVPLYLSATHAVYTGKIDTAPEPFWTISTSDSPPKSETAMIVGDGLISPLADNSTVNITYVDASPYSVTTLLRSAVSRGSLSFFPMPLLASNIGANQSIGVVLRKKSLDTNDQAFQTVSVQVRSHSVWPPTHSTFLSFADTERVILNETSVGSGIFSGSFRAATAPGVSFADAPGVLITPNSTLEAWYPEPGFPAESSDGADGRPWPSASVRIATDASVGSPRVHSSTPGAGERLTITVVDPDADVRFGYRDIVTVKVSSSRKFEGDERVLLTENLADTRNLSSGGRQGVFTGVLDTKFTTVVSPSGDGVLNVNQGDTLTLEYQEESDAQGTAGTLRTSQAVMSAPGLPAIIALEPQLLFENEQLCVTLLDDTDVGSPEVHLKWRSKPLAEGADVAVGVAQEEEAEEGEEVEAEEPETVEVICSLKKVMKVTWRANSVPQPRTRCHHVVLPHMMS